jgi:hypothetical protein
MTFADLILAFNQHLSIEDNLPDNIRVLYPYQENPEVVKIATAFYKKYYDDQQVRKLILGINPGRLGAGATGVPFTDPKRLKTYCDIDCSFSLHEPSSVFVHEVIQAYGGVEKFFGDYYISSVCPLGFVKIDEQGRETNYNYYDSHTLAAALTPFILSTLREQINFGLDTQKVYCLGTGKNFKFLKNLNQQHQLFGEVVPLEHPRYVMQYKSKTKDSYIDKYLRNLGDVQ